MADRIKLLNCVRDGVSKSSVTFRTDRIVAVHLRGAPRCANVTDRRVIRSWLFCRVVRPVDIKMQRVILSIKTIIKVRHVGRWKGYHFCWLFMV